MPTMPSDLRLHPSSILFGLASAIRSFALPGIVVLATAGTSGWTWQLWALPLVIPYALVSIGRYFTFRYRYEANEMVIRTGFLFRNERHVPYARIQTLDATQNVFHRMLDVVEVRVETGGGTEPEAKMSVLPIAAYEDMRRRVFEGKGGVAAPEASPEAVPAAGRTLLHLPLRELVLCGLVQNRGGLILGAAFGLMWELQVMDGFSGPKGPERKQVRAFLKELLGLDWLPGIGSVGGIAGGVAITLAVIAGLVVLFRLISMAWAVVRLHGFRLTLTGEDLRTEYGLLTRVVATIPLRRIQTLTVYEGPLHRLFGRASVRVDTAGADGGGDNEESGKVQREWLAPILHRSALPGLVREVLPGMDLAAAKWEPAPARAFRRELKGWLIFAAAILLPLVFLWRGRALFLLPVLLAWAWIGARKTVANLGWAVTGDAVLFRSGWLWRKVSVAPFTKIQAVAVHESPFDRRAAMARVKVDTAGAGDTSHGVDIPYLPRETALGLRDLLARQAAQTAFRW